MNLDNRRATDRIPMDIEAMILEANDPERRALLIVLNAMNSSLSANTKMTTELGQKLDTHLENFAERARADDALLNKGRGAWRVMAGVIAVAQMIGIGLWMQVRSEFSVATARIERNMVLNERQEEQLLSLSRQIDGWRK